MTDIKEQLYALNKMSKISVALYHKVALSFGVSDSSLSVLYALLEADPPRSQYDLSNDWFIPKQTINSTVAALQKKEFVSLSPITGAKNKKSIALTDAGKEFVENTVGKLRDAELRAFMDLTPEEREIYIRLNQKYNQALIANLECFLSGSDQG